MRRLVTTRWNRANDTVRPRYEPPRSVGLDSGETDRRSHEPMDTGCLRTLARTSHTQCNVCKSVKRTPTRTLQRTTQMEFVAN
jgi:hypothetical protein